MLTDRDRCLVDQLYRFHLLTRDQAMACAGFHSLTRANTRFGNLLHARIISRKRLPVIPGHGSAQSLYYLGRDSSIALGADAADIPTLIRRVSRWDARQANHVLAANQVIIDFLAGSRMTPEVRLLSFRTEPELRRIFLRQPFVPDGWIAWTERGRRFNVFTEVDLSHEGLTQWRRKVMDYMRYRESGLHQELFSFRGFRVIVLAATDRRLHNLRTISGPSASLFLFAKFADVSAGTILGRAWLPATGGEPVSLAEAP